MTPIPAALRESMRSARPIPSIFDFGDVLVFLASSGFGVKGKMATRVILVSVFNSKATWLLQPDVLL